MVKYFSQKIRSSLLWSQRYTKTDMVYTAKGSFWLISSQVVSTLAAFVLSIVYANLLPKETYGTYKYILSVFSILALTTLPGINTALTRSVAKGFEKSLSAAIGTKIKWGVIGGAFSLVLAIYYLIAGSQSLFYSFAIAAIFIPLIDSFGAYESFLQGKKLFKTSASYWVISRLTTATLIIAAIFFTKNLIFILLAYFVPLTLAKFIFLWLSIKKINQQSGIDPEMKKFGKHLSWMTFWATIARYIDSLIIFHFLGTVELAIYSFAIAPADQIKNVLKSVPALALPKFSQKSLSEIKKNIYQRLAIFSAFLVIATIAYILAAPFIYKIFFPAYTDSILLSQIFALSMTGIASTIPITILQSQQKIKVLHTHNYLTSIFQIILIIVLVYFYGLLGAITARVIGRFFTLITAVWFLHQAD